MSNNGFDGFDFEDESSSDMDFDDGFDIESNENELGDFANNAQNVNEISAGKSTVIKQAAIIAIVGLILVVLAFAVVRWLTGGDSSDSKKADTQQSQQSQQTQVQTNNQSNSSKDQSWKAFTDADIQFESEYIETTFTITDIKHYVKVESASGNLIVKTELTGSIKGLAGLYTIDIPYYKGNQLSVKNHFDIKVQMGSYNGKVVVGEIKY